MPAPVLPKSLASPSTMAFIMVGKYVDALPLYRQEQQLARLGVDLSRQTLSNWMLMGSKLWLRPIYDRMHELLLELDNNRSERSIKPFVIGRKNWMFSNTPRGATASATIYSIIETAKENGLNPFT